MKRTCVNEFKPTVGNMEPTRVTLATTMAGTACSKPQIPGDGSNLPSLQQPMQPQEQQQQQQQQQQQSPLRNMAPTHEVASPTSSDQGTACCWPNLLNAMSGSALPSLNPAAPSGPMFFTMHNNLNLNRFGGFSNKPAKRSPQADITEGEMLVVNDMNQLSLNERNVIYEDIHGVAPIHAEERELVNVRLQELDKELRYQNDKAAYDKALFLNPTYVRDRQFRLMFLRAEDFHAAKAAKRMVHHFQAKQQLFGSDKIARSITWEDLNEDTKRAIEQGDMHLFPFNNDRAGRAILFKVYAFRKDEDTIAHYQKYWYLFMSCFERHVEAQRKGLVVVLYALGSTAAHFMSEMQAQRERIAWSKCLPYRVSAIHFCVQDERLKHVFSILQAAVPKHLRLRQRTHVGSHLECHYALSSFGIGDDMIPVSSNGDLKRRLFQDNLQRLRRTEMDYSSRQGSERVADSASTCHVDTVGSYDRNNPAAQLPIHDHDNEYRDDWRCTPLEEEKTDLSDAGINDYRAGAVVGISSSLTASACVDIMCNQQVARDHAAPPDGVGSTGVISNPECHPVAPNRKARKVGSLDASGVTKGATKKGNNARCKKQAEETTHKIVMCATDSDVLLGRGIPFQRHSGNLKLMQIIESHRPLHEKSSRREKAVIAKSIVRQVKQSGGRFLKRNTEYANPIMRNQQHQEHESLHWIEVDDSIAREKVAMGFRNKKRSG